MPHPYGEGSPTPGFRGVAARKYGSVKARRSPAALSGESPTPGGSGGSSPREMDREEREGERSSPNRGDRAVEVGFEPTEGLPPHTLSRSAATRSPGVGTVRELGPGGQVMHREQPRTLANETRT